MVASLPAHARRTICWESSWLWVHRGFPFASYRSAYSNTEPASSTIQSQLISLLAVTYVVFVSWNRRRHIWSSNHCCEHSDSMTLALNASAISSPRIAAGSRRFRPLRLLVSPWDFDGRASANGKRPSRPADATHEVAIGLVRCVWQVPSRATPSSRRHWR